MSLEENLVRCDPLSCILELDLSTSRAWLRSEASHTASSITVRNLSCLKLLLVLIVCVLFSAALGVQQPSLLGASPTIYTQQTALAAAGLTTQTPTNYQLTQTAALQQQAAAAAAALQQVKKKEHLLLTLNFNNIKQWLGRAVLSREKQNGKWWT